MKWLRRVQAPPGNDQYVLLDRIGGGAHGEVWRARGPDGSHAAVKLLALGGRDSPGLSGPVIARELRLRFYQEQAFRFAHPCIAGPRGTTTFGHEPALVMDLVDGRDLHQFSKANPGGLPDPVLVDVARDVLEGLAFLHGEGVIHRDISPANILVCRDAAGAVRARISDFGSALDLNGPRLTSTPGIVGTVGFAAPETLAGDDADERSDLFSLGATLRAVRPTPPNMESAALTQLIAGLTSEDPRRRPHSAPVALRMLDGQSRSSLPVNVPTLPRPPSLRRYGPGLRRLATVGAVLLVVLSVGGFVAATRSAERRGHSTVSSSSGAERQPSPTLRQLSNETLAGYDAAVVADPQGKPLVAHSDFKQGTLLLTRCGDLACTTSTDIAVTAKPRSGYYPALAARNDGSVLLAYQNSARGTLELAECADPSCTQRARQRLPIGTELETYIATEWQQQDAQDLSAAGEPLQPQGVVNPEASDRNTSLQPSVAVAGDRVLVAYYDALTGRSVLMAGSPAARGGPALAWQRLRSWPGNHTTLGVLEPEGRPVLTGTVGAIPELGSLWMSVCRDASCTQADTWTFDGLVSSDTALVVRGRTALVVTTVGRLRGDVISDDFAEVFEPRLAVVQMDVATEARPERPRLRWLETPPAGALGAPLWTAPSIAVAGSRWGPSGDATTVVAYRANERPTDRGTGGFGVVVCDRDWTCRATLANAIVDAPTTSAGHDPAVLARPQGVFVAASRLPRAGRGQSAGSLWGFTAPLSALRAERSSIPVTARLSDEVPPTERVDE